MSKRHHAAASMQGMAAGGEAEKQATLLRGAKLPHGGGFRDGTGRNDAADPLQCRRGWWRQQNRRIRHRDGAVANAMQGSRLTARQQSLPAAEYLVN